MRSYHLLVIILLVFLGFMGCPPTFVFAAVDDKEDEKVTKATEKQKTTLIELYSYSTVLPKALIDLQADLDRDQNIFKIEKEIPKLTDDISELKWETSVAGTNPDIQLMEIATFQNKVHRITARLNHLRKPIAKAIDDLSKKRKEWQEKQTEINTFKVDDIESFDLAKEQMHALQATIESASVLIEQRLTLALRLGKSIGEFQISAHEIESGLKALSDEKITVSVQQTSPSMLSPLFYEKFKPSVYRQAYANLKLVIKEQTGLITEHLRLVVAVIIILMVISFILHRSKKQVPSTSRWYPFATCNVATALFMATTIYAILDMMGKAGRIPDHQQPFFHILLLLAVIRLTRHLVHSRWQRGLLIPLSVFMVLIIVMVIINVPQVFMLLFVFYVSLVALLFYFMQLPGTRGLYGNEAWARRLLGLLPGIVVISGMFGYDQFAVIIFATVLSAITASLIVWVMYVLCLGILDYFLIILPFDLLSENREKIVTRVKPIVASLHFLLFIAVQLVIWDFQGTVSDAIQMIFNRGFQLGTTHITPGFLLVVAFILYTTLLLSKGIQTLLLSRVLPVYGAEKGVQLSIARLVHYATLMIGFLFVLRVLGFELNQLTILGGALGVGIGFGLQAIVNNFASGLILLFERPIKVGDTVQIGTELGEVKNMGLRATVIQTFDNAEIVVPNSDLITGQVTNWTLAERKVRVRVTVGVAYGSEVDKVMEVLLGCANNNPRVLSKPAPRAFFLAFGASSLDFELRVWIPEFLDKTQVLSELNQDIENEFAINEIEVPFPQTDLHLRSVDTGVSQVLGNKLG